MTPEVWVRSQPSVAYDDPGVAAKAAEVLDDRERRRWRRLLDPGAKRDYLAAHLLRRGMLAARSAFDAAAFRFRSSAGGRARIVDPPAAAGFRTSLAQADGMALCALSYGVQLGANVESRRNLSGDLLRISAMVESRRAIRALEEMPQPLREEWLLRVWTVREAIAKAGGVGAEEAALESPPDAVWQYICWSPSRDHLAAGVVRRPGPRQGVSIRIEGDMLALLACA